ncbi:MAG: hypothetical protein ACOYNI_01105 [Acidimicrobiia bacterium]
MSDWASDAADAVERVVSTVRDRTVEPAQLAAKYLVYGLVAAFLVSTALTMLAIASFRLLNVVLPVWASYLVLGGILVAGGSVCWILRTPRTQGASQ